MTEYELMAVLRPDIDPKDVKAIEDIIHKLVSDTAKVKSVTVIGKKTLAYPINKHKEALYVSVSLHGSHMNTAELERKMKLGTDVIRYLLTIK